MLGIVKKCALGMLLIITGFSDISAQTDVDTRCQEFNAYVPLFTQTWNPLWNMPAITTPNTPMKQTKVPGLNVATYFKGLLEYLPAGYNPANTSEKHPLIIYFHGRASRGNGSKEELCRLFKDNGNDDKATFKALPGQVENNTSQFTKGAYKYIVVSPQFYRYERAYPPATPASDFPDANKVSDMIDYVISRYPGKIDERRIYLTGYSNGANMIMEYVGSSLARAQKIAAVMPVALCSQLTHSSNIALGVDAANIANAKLKTWFVQCAIDNPCGLTSQGWVDSIKKVPGNIAPRYTVLKDANPATMYNCSDSLLHDAWSRAYDPNFTASFVDGTGANDGVNLNVYDWFITQTNTVLPVTLKNFTARLANNKVELKWTTSEEKDNAYFTIERAGSDQQFKSIGTVPGSKTHTGEKTYFFTDNDPLAALGFYRLVQTDIDGKKNYFDIKKIYNEVRQQSSVLISPNPFTTEISAFVSLQKSQKVNIMLTDMTGKILRTSNGIYAQGSSEVKINAENLPNGVYLLKVSGENINITQKIIRK